MTTFYTKLATAWKTTNSLVCVGLDPDLKKFPAALKGSKRPIFDFNRAIIDGTAEFASVYKPQMAFYSAENAEDQLLDTIQYIRERAPHAVVILDAKRGDIANTAEAYATEAFDRFKADAVTVNPYLGGDSIEPFSKRTDRGVIVLCRTSNPGARDVQDLKVDGRPLYSVIASKAANEWNKNGNLALVVGATYPAELREVREIIGTMPLLVPGIGAQGGDIEAAVTNGKSADGTGMIINSSRGIIYASNGDDFGKAAGNAARELRDKINEYR